VSLGDIVHPMNILCAFDKFKDSLSAKLVGEAVFNGLVSSGVKCTCRNIPLSDGGEGFFNTLKIPLHLETKSIEITGPLGKPIHSVYGFNEDTSVIEMSLCCGLELISNKCDRNPMHTTTRGVGEMILDSMASGRNHIILGIGGSSTNDGGLGALDALGLTIKGYDIGFPFTGKDMAKITEIDCSKLPKNLKIEIACDVSNPFVGSSGAVAIFSKQKGASPQDQLVLEHGMENAVRLISETTGNDISNIPGTGAAGGIAGGFLGLLNAKLVPGSDLIAKSVGLEDLIAESDVVFTGEGCYDDQTDLGKIVSKVIHLCKLKRKPCVVICGTNIGHHEDNVFDLLSMFDKNEAMRNTSECLIKLVKEKSDKIQSLVKNFTISDNKL
jgi:glycerate kinase